MLKAFAIMLVLVINGNQTPIKVYSESEETCLNELEYFMKEGVQTPWGKLMPLDGRCVPADWETADEFQKGA